MSYHSLRVIVESLFRLILRRQVLGEERFPADPPYILATNHLSIFDAPLLMTICPHPVRPFVAAKHKRNPLYGTIVRPANPIWVRRGEVDRGALREALNALKNGHVLGVAPEGTRARGPYALQKAKTGAAYLATRTDALIVPIGLAGPERIKDNLPRLRRTGVRIEVGKPFRLPESGRVRGEKLDEYTDMIMQRIAAVLPEAYRGVYG